MRAGDQSGQNDDVRFLAPTLLDMLSVSKSGDLCQVRMTLLYELLENIKILLLHSSPL